MAKLVSKTYGDALFDLALEENKLDGLYEEVSVLSDAIQENEELHKLMSHPRVTKEDKIKLADNIMKDRFSDELTGFVRLLVTNGRFSELALIFEYFIHMVKEYKKIGIAYVQTAVEISDEQKQQVIDKLLQTTDYKSFEMHFSVDKELMGGMIIRINDRVVDSSIKTKLQDISGELYNIQLA